MQTRAPVVVGRDRELSVLHRCVADARAGNGGTVFLVGEPGIGKSRLAATATGAAFDGGLRALRGRGSVIGPMVPYRPLTEALLSLSRSGDVPDLGRLAEYRPVLGRLIPEWGSATSPDVGPSSVVVLAEAVLRLLALVGEQRGCLLVLEDLQDADAETLGVLEYLVDNVPGQPVLLVATIRSEPCDAVELARSAGARRTAEVLELSGLDRAQVAELAAACLDVAAEALPSGAAERLWVDSAGNPFVVEELLHGMVAAGLLVNDGEHWRVVGDLRTEVPAAVVRSIAGRTDRLGEPARTLLSLAAVLGRRFSLTVLRRTTGADDRTILANLRAGVAAQLVTPDEPAPDWYAFRHPLTAEALLAALSPGQRGELSDRAADAVEHLYPDLPGDWCQLVASLRLAAGDQDRAGELFAEAGRRAMDDGAAVSAVALLDRAHRLLSASPDLGLRATTLERLLLALGETGRFDRAFELAGALDELGELGLAAPRWAGLHARLASVARLAGRVDDGTTHVAAARALLGPHAGDEHTAPVDCIDAYLALSQPGPDRLQAAASLATRAVEAAERVPLPLVACDALQLLGVISREHDLAESDTYFDRSRAIAERHHLPIKRLYALVLRAGTACLLDGEVAELERAGAEASRLGAITLVHEVDGSLALQAVLRGEYARAAGMIEDGLRSTTRLRFDRLTRYLLMVRATLAAHHGDRAGMEAALADFHGRGGESYDLSLAYGLAGAFCGLLEEDRAVADRELDQVLAYEERSPTTFHLAGRNGLHLLLGVLDGRSGWEQHRAVTATAASGMRWNSHFVWLATAVLHGCDGRDDSAAMAEQAMERAAAAGALFPMAAHLGLRLVADAAHDAGWGRPAEWLLAAERYFHDAGVPAVASACRASLRRIGASVPQRRSGVDRLPLTLRTLGMTVREFEVFQLLADRLGNKAIGARLHISPRTVEKHVASLMAKTRQPDREALSVYARTALA